MAPYAPGFERALQGLAHGWKPTRGDLKRISQDKAKAMLAEAKRAGQEKAIRES